VTRTDAVASVRRPRKCQYWNDRGALW